VEGDGDPEEEVRERKNEKTKIQAYREVSGAGFKNAELFSKENRG